MVVVCSGSVDAVETVVMHSGSVEVVEAAVVCSGPIVVGGRDAFGVSRSC